MIGIYDRKIVAVAPVLMAIAGFGVLMETASCGRLSQVFGLNEGTSAGQLFQYHVSENSHSLHALQNKHVVCAVCYNQNNSDPSG